MLVIILLWLLLTLALEILVYLPSFWKWRRQIAIAILALLPGLTIVLLFLDFSVAALLFALVSVLRIVNMFRLAQNRLKPERLFKVSVRTSGYSLLIQAILIVSINSFMPSWPGFAGWAALLSLQLVVAAMVYLITTRTLKRLTPQLPEHFLPDKELPTLTVAIPARNETPELVECLTSLVQNDYPKLEIIVLDDCSHDKTPAVIKQFAHDGVRFIQGEEPNDRWLAKNAAYERLMQEATGELILFCGVDVRFAPRSLRLLVNTMVARQKKMMSVLPTRADGSAANAVLQPLRYWWELALPRRLLNRPAVLSTCWIIERQSLLDMGGFKSVSRSVLPERLLARSLVKTDGYSFVRSTADMPVETTKSLQAQRETVVRMRYPQVHRRLELSFALALAEVTLLIGPYVTLLYAAATGHLTLLMPALLAICLLTLTHYKIVQATNVRSSLMSIPLFPVAVVVELVLGIESALKYEFSTVDWKGRNICLPVMQVIPKLPDTDHK